MLAGYFGFSGEPFVDSPGPAFVDSNLSLRGFYARLMAGIAERRGVMLIVGEPGSGKTSLLLKLRDETIGRDRMALFNASADLSFDDLLHQICTSVGIPAAGRARMDLARAFVNDLIAAARSGQTTVILVDDAETLGPDVLRNLHLLSELGDRRLLQIVLAGSTALEATLQSAELQALERNIAFTCHLPRLTSEDVKRFIEHQLTSVGCATIDLFPTSTIERIADQSRGRPAMVNAICNQALLITSLEGHRFVSIDSVDQATKLVLSSRDGKGPAGFDSLSGSMSSNALDDRLIALAESSALLADIERVTAGPATASADPALRPISPASRPISTDAISGELRRAMPTLPPMSEPVPAPTSAVPLTSGSIQDDVRDAMPSLPPLDPLPAAFPAGAMATTTDPITESATKLHIVQDEPSASAADATPKLTSARPSPTTTPVRLRPPVSAPARRRVGLATAAALVAAAILTPLLFRPDWTRTMIDTVRAVTPDLLSPRHPNLAESTPSAVAPLPPLAARETSGPPGVATWSPVPPASEPDQAVATAPTDQSRADTAAGIAAAPSLQPAISAESVVATRAVSTAGSVLDPAPTIASDLAAIEPSTGSPPSPEAASEADLAVAPSEAEGVHDAAADAPATVTAETAIDAPAPAQASNPSPAAAPTPAAPVPAAPVPAETALTETALADTTPAVSTPTIVVPLPVPQAAQQVADKPVDTQPVETELNDAVPVPTSLSSSTPSQLPPLGPTLSPPTATHSTPASLPQSVVALATPALVDAAPTASAITPPAAASSTAGSVQPQSSSLSLVLVNAPTDGSTVLSPPVPERKPVEVAALPTKSTKSPEVGEAKGGPETSSTPEATTTTIASLVTPQVAPPTAEPAEATASLQDKILIERGNRLLVQGDFASARLFFERAAATGNAVAMTAMGKTYDPVVFSSLAVRGARGDAKMALGWYRKAAALGDGEAQALMQRLEARAPQ